MKSDLTRLVTPFDDFCFLFVPPTMAAINLSARQCTPPIRPSLGPEISGYTRVVLGSDVCSVSLSRVPR